MINRDCSLFRTTLSADGESVHGAAPAGPDTGLDNFRFGAAFC
jgi:hypothetical protein